ncbi:hypothetical protein COU54_04245 [Candidatus Pacearchaeota archaeon CG10_big_fil_rev_8_21_14_0_10_31_24]|nr:MAG: hypothetical protein COU54_04245 [Candidatus Pacearchaeota archaeon CG10_big_fil_rev_8_21_14_0_10_31_24]
MEKDEGIFSIIFLSLVFFSSFAYALDSDEECGEYRLSLPLEGFGSEELSGKGSELAFDGDYKTYWMSNYREPYQKYIYFDLGKEVCIDSIDLLSYRRYLPVEVEILVSDDLYSWESVAIHKITRGDEYIPIEFEEVKAKYIIIKHLRSYRNALAIGEIKINAAPIGENELNLPVASEPVKAYCSDSDGKDYFTPGKVIASNFPKVGETTYSDGCWSSQGLYEYYCEDNKSKIDAFYCSYGYSCQDGACVNMTPKSQPTNDCSSCLKLTEWNYDSEGNDCENPEGEFVEFLNGCSYECSLSDWKIRDQIGHEYKFNNFLVNANSKFKVYDGHGDDSNLELYWNNHGTYDVCPAIWNNDGDEIFLYDSIGKLILKDRYFVV